MVRYTSCPSWILGAVAGLSTLAQALPRGQDVNAGYNSSTIRSIAFQPPSPNTVSPHYVPLQRRPTTKQRHFPRTGAGESGISRRAGSDPVGTIGGVEYYIEISLGGTPVNVIIDTGSSDTWVVHAGFECTSMLGIPQAESECGFGPTFAGSFTEGQISGENFNVGYGSGETLSGVVGHEDITIGSITVKDQEIALINDAYWDGDGTTSGLMGLAFPPLTSAFSGLSRVEYNPVFTSMYKQGLVDPLFSLALTRGSSGGYIAFGGLPPVSYSGSFATTPLQVSPENGIPSTRTQFSFYAITPTAFRIGGTTTSSDVQYIVDSGTTLIYLPTALADRVAAAFSPAAIYLRSEGEYFVECNAKAPEFGVEIGGTTFTVSAADLIDQSQRILGYCALGIADGGNTGPYILGDTFLKNVVAVYDVGGSEMRFAAHVY